ncbi:ABC transporter permease [Flavobacterium sp. N3904]|uniref:ABC transporter permease n=1 Tax=Flavobacterium sp. N3904 TaxID=2986835 RepID=UPI0022249471|nr:ABC transporter permease [Flavobacterium sp. N3904]
MKNVRAFIISFSAFSVLWFLYFPIFIIIWFSFNKESVSSFPIEHYSLDWYIKLFHNQSMINAVEVSFIIAISSTLAALIIGIPSAYALHKYNYFGKNFLLKIILLPITLPGIVTGVAMLSLFPLMGIPLSLKAVFIGHTTFLIGIMITQILARFKKLDPYLEMAAFDLGASPLSAFFRVILPNIKTAIIGAVLLSLVLSMDEIPVTFFLISRENTLPIEIYGMMRRGITPEVNAVATLVFLISSAAIFISLKFNKEN